MKPRIIYNIHPRLPENLAILNELANNLWWDWNYDAVDLFRRLSRRVWDQSNGNPSYILLKAEQERLDYLSTEEGFLNHLERVYTKFKKYMTEPRWFQRKYPDGTGMQIAYFSAEFGLASCLPIYSGGLGILAGDHLKTASDMGLPLVAVGLAYRQGYFNQYLNLDGWQQERYNDNDFPSLPTETIDDEHGNPIIIDIPYLGNPVKAGIMMTRVGRVPLYLLTTNLKANRPEDRIITDQLYGGDSEMRIRQEIVLGIGGTIALNVLGIKPTVYHMNEGHSAFLALERIKRVMVENELDFHSAFQATTPSNCFTTHTPVPAGNDVFSNNLIGKYLKPLANDLNCGWDPFLSLGRDHDLTSDSNYCMTVTALRTAGFANAVSRLHSRVSRSMWHELWPKLPVEEVPIKPITNGVHIYSWISHDMAALFDRYIGADWRNDPLKKDIWNRVHEIPDEELWRTHESRRARLVGFARGRLERQLKNRGASPEEIADATEVLNPEALTIGFARRFATYKRATLLFRNLERLKKLLTNREHPVQIIFAGKAHPRDDAGKQLIRDIVHAARDLDLRSRIVFLEDYGMTVARYLVQGVDVWLNTPRRPLEASGTSGMKAVANGAIHLSVLDGWWDQAYKQDYGWAIGSGEEYEDHAYQDEVEGNALYDLLECDVMPLFYKRSIAQIPRDWVALMKRSMANLIPRFSSHRMVFNYLEDAYMPAHIRQQVLCNDGFARARSLAGWRAKVEQHWDEVSVRDIQVDKQGDVLVGEQITVTAGINCGGLEAHDIQVEVYFGTLDSHQEFDHSSSVSMALDKSSDPHNPTFTAKLTAPQSGSFGLTIRIFPHHADLPHKYAMYRITWAKEEAGRL